MDMKYIYRKCQHQKEILKIEFADNTIYKKLNFKLLEINYDFVVIILRHAMLLSNFKYWYLYNKYFYKLFFFFSSFLKW